MADGIEGLDEVLRDADADEGAGEQPEKTLAGQPEEEEQPGADSVGERLGKFRGEDGSLDVEKLQQSYLNLEKKLGETGAVRGQQQRELEEAKQLLSHPKVVIALRGEAEPEPEPEDENVLEDQINELIEKGRIKDAINVAVGPEIKRLKKALDASDARLDELKKASAKVQVQTEMEKFMAQHVEDGIYAKDHAGRFVPQDEELAITMDAVDQQSGGSLPFEDVLTLAKHRLRRTEQPVARQPKRPVASAQRGGKRAPASVTPPDPNDVNNYFAGDGDDALKW